MRVRTTVVLLFTFSVLPQTVAGSVDVTELYRVVAGYYYAIGENRLDEAMSYYHRDSPQVDEKRWEVAFALTGHLQSTSTVRRW